MKKHPLSLLRFDSQSEIELPCFEMLTARALLLARLFMGGLKDK